MKLFGAKILAVIFLFSIYFSLPSVVNAQLNPVQFYKDSLDNGLQVIYCRDQSAPVVATVMLYGVGSKDEISTQTGYAHFFEHLMFEATENIPRASIDVYVQEAGGNLNASTSFDQTLYYFKLPSNQINLALWIESERMRKLKVEKEGVETQRGVVLEEMKQRTTNQPYGSLFQKIVENLFPATSYGWPVIGYEKNIVSASIDDFRNFYDSFYQPNNATLVIAGDFDAPKAREMVKKYFGGYKRKPANKSRDIIIPPLTKSYREVIEDDKAKLPGIFITFRGPSLSDSNYYAMSLLKDILASGESSRLYQRLVSEEQLSVSASLMPLFLQYSGAIVFNSIAAKEDNVKKIESTIRQELDKIIKNGVSKEELQKAKNINETNFVFDLKNVLGKARALAEYNNYFSDPGMINSELDKFLQVSVDDIKKAAKTFFDTDKYITLIYMPKEN